LSLNQVPPRKRSFRGLHLVGYKGRKRMSLHRRLDKTRFRDDNFSLQDNATGDRANFQLSSLTTNRTLTIPDANGTLALLGGGDGSTFRITNTWRFLVDGDDIVLQKNTGGDTWVEAFRFAGS